MDVKATLNPGQPGTKRLLERYGSQLVCVRYRYDQQSRKRYKTVELIIDETPWIEGTDSRNHHKPLYQQVGPVLIRIAYDETELRAKAKAAGAQWLKDERLWKLPYDTAVQLGLETRIHKFLKADELGF